MTTHSAESAASSADSLARPIRLYPFKTGTVTVPHQWIKNNEFAEELLEVPVPWFVVTHPRGDVIIDGGCAAAAGVDDIAYWGEGVTLGIGMRTHMRPEEACLATLLAHGFEPQRIRYVLQSHLHADHLGALAELGSFARTVRVIASRREYEFARAPDPYYAASYANPEMEQDIDWLLIEDEQEPYDLYGDGVIRAYQTRGHSVGHLSFLVSLPESGSILLTADACYTRDHWEGRSAAGAATSHLEAFRSVQRLHNLAEQYDAQVIYGHDAEQFAQIRQDGAFFA